MVNPLQSKSGQKLVKNKTICQKKQENPLILHCLRLYSRSTSVQTVYLHSSNSVSDRADKADEIHKRQSRLRLTARTGPDLFS